MELREPTGPDDDALRALVARLVRPHASGGDVIERAAILASGPDAMAVLAWIAAHDGEPELPPQATTGRGLYGTRFSGAAAAPTPLRYVLPPGAVR